MENKEYLLVENICTYHKIDISLMDSLHSQGLLNLIYIDDQKYLFHEDLKETEKMIRLYDELGINVEGIDVIFNLLQKLDELQLELEITKKRLSIFEGEFDI